MNTISTSADLTTSASTYLVQTEPATYGQKRTAYDDSAAQQTGNVDAVSFSRTASDYSRAIGSNAPYFPIRSGMNADALILGASKPGTVSSSKDKTFTEVATDARKRMDDKYALMNASGKPYDKSDQDRNSLMGDLDRRSLNAVATNKDGKFTAEEQDAAKGLMRQQSRLATGYYVGPDDQKKGWKDPFNNDPVGRANAALSFLEGMSPEEKATPEWLSQHQTLQAALAQVDQTDPTRAAPKKHFPILAEILAESGSYFD